MSAIEDSAIALYRAHTARKEARKALLDYHRERGGCESGEPTSCFHYQPVEIGGGNGNLLPFEDWCEVCRGSQPLWLAYRAACAKQQGALRGLMTRCKSAGDRS